MKRVKQDDKVKSKGEKVKKVQRGSTGAQGASPQGDKGQKGVTGAKGEPALGTVINQLTAPGDGFSFSLNDGLLTFKSGSFTGIVLMYTSGSTS